MKRDDFNEGKGKDDQLNFTPLFSYSIEGITASVILDLRRPKDNNTFPVKYRITYNRRQSYYPCMNMTVELYDKLHGEVRKQEYSKPKKQIQDGFKRITDTIDELVKDGTFSLEGLAKRLSKGTTNSIMTAFDNRIQELDNEGKVGSSVWYTSARNSIKKYTSKDLKFSDITVDWLKKYQSYMREDGKEFTTISINMRALRAIMNIGLREGIITPAQYPFEIKKNGKYKIPEGKGRKIALSEAQLYDVIDYTLMPDDEIYRDLWLFSFYCNGVNIGDMLRFKYDDIKGNYIEWYRGKTIDTDKEKIKIRALITEEMQDVINKYGNRDKKGYIFPYITAGLSPLQERMIIQNLIHCINKRMKMIGKALGYGDITTYWARHTFASISRRNKVSLFAISKSMGHKKLTTTDVYLDSLSDDELIENAAKMPRRKR
jgi:integrase